MSACAVCCSTVPALCKAQLLSALRVVRCSAGCSGPAQGLWRKCQGHSQHATAGRLSRAGRCKRGRLQASASAEAIAHARLQAHRCDIRQAWRRSVSQVAAASPTMLTLLCCSMFSVLAQGLRVCSLACAATATLHMQHAALNQCLHKGFQIPRAAAG